MANIVLGISAGIAAYKAIFLARLLVQAGHQVQVVLTRSAHAFVTPLSLQAVTGHPVRTDMLDAADEQAMDHIALARWADILLIAPATADIMARCAHGLADDLLTTLILATSAPVAIVPAMNQQMWRHPATQANVSLLKSRGVNIWGPAEGEQACGDVGFGRMIEPEDIMTHLESVLTPAILAGLRCMITLGPTREPIDPVRYISNRSSGKMGLALVEQARNMGADVTAICGPIALPVPTGVDAVHVETAHQMYQAVMDAIQQQDIFISTAAVADFTVLEPADHKLKKSGEFSPQWAATLDILAEVAALERAPVTVGFAAETEGCEAYAQDKFDRKQLDMIAVNDVSDTTIGFDANDNALTLISRHGKTVLPKMSKLRCAAALLEHLKATLIHEYSTENTES